jgi:hypothetical protein
MEGREKKTGGHFQIIFCPPPSGRKKTEEELNPKNFSSL